MKLNKIESKTNWTIVIASVVVASTVVGELFSRYILGLGDPPLSISHPTIEYMFKPNQKVNRFGNKVIINQYGMRSQGFSQEKNPGVYRLLVIGDSVINGGNLTDQRDLATEIVKKKLQEVNNRSVVVGNISAGTWGPGNWLAYAKEYGFFEADEIILVINSGDYADNPTFDPLSPTTHPQKKPILAIQEGFSRYLLPRIASNIGKNKHQQKKEKVVTASDIQEGLDDLEQFLLLAQNTGAEINVIQYWNKSEVESGKLNKGHREIQKVVENLNIAVSSTGRRFQKASQSQLKLFRDEIHPTSEGQKLLAESMLAVLNYKQTK